MQRGARPVASKKRTAVQQLTPIQVALNENKGRIQRSLADALPIDKYLQLTANVINNSRDLSRCSPASIVSAVLQAAEVRLFPGNVLGHAYLVPYKGNCTFILGYKGILQLCHRSPKVLKVEAHTVHEGDEFDYTRGGNGTLEHRPEPFGERTVKNCLGAYAIATLANGEFLFEVMSSRELNAIRSRAKSKNGPWKTDTLAMYRKTCVRKLSAWLPLESQDQAAIADDEARDLGYDKPRDVEHEESVSDQLNKTEDEAPIVDAEPGPPTLSAEQAMKIEEWLASDEVDQKAVQGYVKDTVGRDGIAHLTESEADALIDALELNEFATEEAEED